MMRNLFRTTISSISYIRNLFPDNCFTDRILTGVPIKTLRPITDESKLMCKWLEEGVFDTLTKKYLKTIIFAIEDEGNILKENKKELEILGVDISNLKKVKTPFKKITYKEAIKKLKEKGHKIKYGDDFGVHEERGLAKYYGDKFVFVTNYPLSLLKFYHGEDPKSLVTGTNFNLLAPKIGEMVDGSQRDRKSTRLNSSHTDLSLMPSSA